MKHYKEKMDPGVFKRLGLRLLCLSPLWIPGIVVLVKAKANYDAAVVAGTGISPGAAIQLFSVVGLFIAVGIFLAQPVAEMMSNAFSGMLYPVHRYSSVPPMYSKAEGHFSFGRYEQAVLEYIQVMQTHPQEIKPYLETITILILYLKNFDRAETLCAKGVATLKSKEDRDHVQALFIRLRDEARQERPKPEIKNPDRWRHDDTTRHQE